MKFTLFQNWVLVVLFQNTTQSFTEKQLMIRCCDSAIEELTEKKIMLDLDELKTNGLVSYNRKQDMNTINEYHITTSGILYVRKELLKPISDFVETTNSNFFKTKIRTPIAANVISIIDTSKLSNGQLNKQVFNQKLIDLAVNSIGPFMNLLSKILTIVW